MGMWRVGRLLRGRRGEKEKQTTRRTISFVHKAGVSLQGGIEWR